jgi:hypothetical protein
MKHFLKNNRLHQIFFGALLLALALGQLQRVQLTESVALYIHDLVIISWLSAAAAQHFFHRPTTALRAYNLTALAKQIRHSPSIWLLGWLLLTTIIGAVLDSSIVPLLYLGRLCSYLALLLFLAHSGVISNDWLRRASIWLGLSWLTLGFLQLALIPDLRSLRWLGFDDHYYRLASTFFDPNFAGVSFILTLVFLLTFFSWRRFDWRVLLASSALMIGIAATYSRASYLSVAAALALYVALNRTARALHLGLLSTAVILGILSWWLLPKPGGEGVDLTRTTSITARTSASSTELQSLQPEHLLLGRGLYTSNNTYSLHREQILPNHARVPDNFFLMLLVAGGVPAVLLGLAAIGEWIRSIWSWQPPALAAFGALLLHAQFNNSILEPFLFLFFGVGVVALYRTNVTKRS